jgi:hypothetical protein
MAFNKKVIEVTEDPKILKILQECQDGYEECLKGLDDVEAQFQEGNEK